MEYLEEIMNTHSLKESSAKQYASCLNKLEVFFDGNLHETLLGDGAFDKVQEFIKDRSHSTQKTYNLAVHSILCGEKHYGGAPCKHPYGGPYHRRMRGILEQITNKEGQQEKTQKQEDNWATLEELTDLMKKYAEEAKPLMKDDAPLPDIIKIQKWVILSLYLADRENPPIRSEYGDMVVIFKIKGKPLTTPMNPSKNYLFVKGPRSMEIILNEYKTVGSQGKKVFKVGKTLGAILRQWLKTVGHQSGDPLLIKKRGGVLGRNGLSKMLMEITAPIGKRISVQMLRHIFITETLPQPKLSEKKEIADKMCHSVPTQELYIKN